MHICGGGGYSHLAEGTPSQVSMGWYPHPRSGQRGTSIQDQDGSGIPLHPGQVPGKDRGYVPQLEQHSMYLLCDREYASCVHAGGLSCF